MRKSFYYLVGIMVLGVVIGSSLAIGKVNWFKQKITNVVDPGGTARLQPPRLVAIASQVNVNGNTVTISGSGHAQADDTQKQYVGGAEFVIQQ